MLTIFGKSRGGYCDGVSRRSFLKIGAVGVAGLTLADVFRLEALAGNAPATGSSRSLINVFLAGGPSHTDMFDLKPDAPSEFRGEFSPISTNVAGLQCCELMPRLAKQADQYTIIRSVVGTYEDHSSYHTQTGWGEKEHKSVGGFPSIGSVVSKLQGGRGEAPAFVSTMGMVPFGFLGPVHGAYLPDGPGRSNLTLTRIPAERLQDRTKLLAQLDDVKRNIDASGAMDAMDAFTKRAVDVVTGGRIAEALDLEKEDPEIRERYHSGSRERRGESDNLLMARRLVEAGVRVVSTTWGGWDTHSRNFIELRDKLPAFDGAIAALLQDLKERGLSNDVTVVVWGEFGRTPRVNATGGRDHWPRVMQAMVAGGGMKMGQVIGATDRVGGEAADRPVHLREIFATLYNRLGIDAKRTTLKDPAGRPQYLVDGYDPIHELVG